MRFPSPEIPLQDEAESVFQKLRVEKRIDLDGRNRAVGHVGSYPAFILAIDGMDMIKLHKTVGAEGIGGLLIRYADRAPMRLQAPSDREGGIVQGYLGGQG